MAIPHNEITKQMAEELMKDWLESDAAKKWTPGLFTDFLVSEHTKIAKVFDMSLPIQRQRPVYRWQAQCIPIVPPGQWDTSLGEDDAEQPKGTGIEHIKDGYFEKKIGRIGGPLPPDKLKAQPMTDPTIAVQQTAAIHRAIQIARK